MSEIACARIECPKSAILILKTPTGWANFCRGHYVAHFTAEARLYCQANGLTTRDKQLAFITENLAGLGKSRDPRKWARELIEKALREQRLLPIQKQLALEALGMKRMPKRVPGEDDQ